MTASRRKPRSRKTRELMMKAILSLGFIVLAGLIVFFFIAKHFSPPSAQHSNRARQISNENGKVVSKKVEESTSMIKQKDEKQSTIYLTFDDGPSSSTNEILDILQNYQAKATFFMLAPHMEEHQEAVKRIVADGHGAGLHGVTHQANHFYQSKQTAVGEMDEAQLTLENITGLRSFLIRPPYGSVPYLTQPYRKALVAKGYKLWDWTVDSDDWALSNETYVQNTINQILKAEKLGERLVVLMHDKPETAKYLPELLDYLTKQGYQMEKIDKSIKSMHFQCYDRCHPFEN